MKTELDNITIDLEVFAVQDGKKVWMQGSLMILINGKRPYSDDDIVDAEVFLESLEKNGEYFIFSCLCGVPKCSGWHSGIQVLNKNQTINWTNLNKNQSWSFDKESIYEQVKAIRQDVIFYKKYFKQKEIHYIGVGYSW